MPAAANAPSTWTTSGRPASVAVAFGSPSRLPSPPASTHPRTGPDASSLPGDPPMASIGKETRRELTPLDEARALVLAAAPPPGAEEVALGEALGRVLAADVASDAEVPAFDNSAMDGYA